MDFSVGLLAFPLVERLVLFGWQNLGSCVINVLEAGGGLLRRLTCLKSSPQAAMGLMLGQENAIASDV